MNAGEACKECNISNSKYTFFIVLKRYTALLAFTLGCVLFSANNISELHPLLLFLSNRWISSILENIGLALIIFSIFNIIIDTEAWKAYFADRLSDIVQTEAYLKRLDRDTLNVLKTKIYKIIHGAEYISGEQSFFSYIDDKLSFLIGSNHRRDVVSSISISVKEDERTLFVEDTMQYTIVKVGDKMACMLPWLFKKDEVVKLYSVTMYAILNTGEEIILYCENTEQKLTKNELSYGGDGDLSKIEGFNNLSEIKIKVEFVYEMNIDQYFIWQMTFPTHTYVVSIHYPENYNIQFDHFGLEDSASGTQDQTGLFTFRYDSWMLPRSGVVWGLIRGDRSRDKKSGQGAKRNLCRFLRADFSE